MCPNAVPAQADSSSAKTEEIKYRDLTFRLPRSGWRRQETEGWLALTRKLSPNRDQTLLVVPVEVPPQLQTHMVGQHSSAYFEMQRTQPRPAEDRWQEFTEVVQKADSREFAAMTFTITKNSMPSVPLVHGVSVLYFPSDFAQRQRFYCFMLMDNHLPGVVPTSEDLASLTMALASASPAPIPHVEAALSRLNVLQIGAAISSSDLVSAKTAAARAIEDQAGEHLLLIHPGKS